MRAFDFDVEQRPRGLVNKFFVIQDTYAPCEPFETRYLETRVDKPHRVYALSMPYMFARFFAVLELQAPPERLFSLPDYVPFVAFADDTDIDTEEQSRTFQFFESFVIPARGTVAVKYRNLCPSVPIRFTCFLRTITLAGKP